MKTLRMLAAAALAAASTAAFACGEWLPKHGGLMNQGGETSFELVAKGKELVLHLEDHGAPIATEGSRAVLQVEGQAGAWSVPLQPAGDNLLRTVLPQELLPGDRLLAKVTLANGSMVGGRVVFLVEAQGTPPLPTAGTAPFRFR